MCLQCGWAVWIKGLSPSCSNTGVSDDSAAKHARTSPAYASAGGEESDVRNFSASPPDSVTGRWLPEWEEDVSRAWVTFAVTLAWGNSLAVPTHQTESMATTFPDYPIVHRNSLYTKFGGWPVFDLYSHIELSAVFVKLKHLCHDDSCILNCCRKLFSTSSSMSGVLRIMVHMFSWRHRIATW